MTMRGLIARRGAGSGGRQTWVKLGMLVMLALPLGFGWLFYVYLTDALAAVWGAERIQGTISKVVSESYTYDDDGSTRTGYSHVLYVSFAARDGRRVTRPVQHGGSGSEDVDFADDLIDIDAFTPGTVVALLYHPERGDAVWLDDVRALWLLPLILGVATLLAGFLVIGALVVLWPKPPVDIEALHRARLREQALRERYGRRP